MSSLFLRNASLTIVLIALSLPASAEVLTLVCSFESSDKSFMFQIDNDRKIIERVFDYGKDMSLPAHITDDMITWDGVNETGRTDGAKNHFWGTLNRLSGKFSFMSEMINDGYRPQAAGASGSCRQATHKF